MFFGWSTQVSTRTSSHSSIGSCVMISLSAMLQWGTVVSLHTSNGGRSSHTCRCSTTGTVSYSVWHSLTGVSKHTFGPSTHEHTDTVRSMQSSSIAIHLSGTVVVLGKIALLTHTGRPCSSRALISNSWFKLHLTLWSSVHCIAILLLHKWLYSIVQDLSVSSTSLQSSKYTVLHFCSTASLQTSNGCSPLPTTTSTSVQLIASGISKLQLRCCCRTHSSTAICLTCSLSTV